MQRLEAIVTNHGEIKVREAELPSIIEGTVRIKVHASLISPGTEIAMIKSRRQKYNPKVKTNVFGYSNAGEIIEICGDCKGLIVGMRVAAMGARAASHANYANVPVNMVVPIADNVSYEQAVYACLGATSLQAIRRTDPKLGEYGLVLGLGIVGNLAAQLSQISGARIMSWESISKRSEIAQKCGIKNIVNFMEEDVVEKAKLFAAPYGSDFAIFAFGGNADKAWEDVKNCMKTAPDTHQMGRITLVGGCQMTIGGGAASGNLDIRAASRTGAGYHDKAYEYGNDYPNAFVQFTTRRNLFEIVQLISEQRLIINPMTTHKFPLSQISKAVELLINSPDIAMGCILQMSH